MSQNISINTVPRNYVTKDWGVDIMEFKDIVMSRYATKKFDGKKLPESKINELLELVRFAPSALNLQPWKIKIVTDQKTERAT